MIGPGSDKKSKKTFLISDIVDQGPSLHTRRVGVRKEVLHFRNEREIGEFYMGELFILMVTPEHVKFQLRGTKSYAVTLKSTRTQENR